MMGAMKIRASTVFVAVCAALALHASLALHAQTKPWEQDWKGRPPAYYFNTGDGTFWVYEREIERQANGSVILWLHGNHLNNRAVRYRTSLWHVRLDCAGGYSMDALTTFSPTGAVIDNWDGIGSRAVIRPGTMYQALQEQICKVRGAYVQGS
jgi:hypothetical protein